MKVSELFEATAPKKPEFKKYPDTKAGVLAFMNNPGEVKASFTKSLDLPTCSIHADPEVAGVWAVDSKKTGSRVIIYLGGYKDPMGELRDYNDFEEGSLPYSEIRSLVSSGELTRKQLKAWQKIGNLEEKDLAKIDKEFDDDEYYVDYWRGTKRAWSGHKRITVGENVDYDDVIR